MTITALVADPATSTITGSPLSITADGASTSTITVQLKTSTGANLLVGGDVLSQFHINRLREQFSQLKIINGYGPTENTTFSTTHLIQQKYDSPIPIGCRETVSASSRKAS